MDELKLAIKGRLAAIVLLLLCSMLSSGYEAAIEFLIVCGVFANVKADVERRGVSDMFGCHMPDAVADMMIVNKGALQLVERDATIIICNLGGVITQFLGDRCVPDRCLLYPE